MCDGPYGGLQIRNTVLVGAGRTGAARIPGGMDKGYDHILKECPRHTENFAQLRFVANERLDETSPLLGWSKAVIKEAISAIASETSIATTERYCPITILDIAPDLRALLKPLMSSFGSKSMVMLGKPGWG